MSSKIKVVSPKAVFQFPDLLTPRAFKDGEIPAYQCTLLLDPSNPEHQSFMNKVEESYNYLYDECYKTLDPIKKKAVKKLDLDEIFPDDVRVNKDTQEVIESGLKKFKASQKSIINSKNGQKNVTIAVVDSAKNPVRKGTEIWSGSSGRLVITLEAFYAPDKKQISLVRRLSSAQVININNGASDDLDMFGIEGEGISYEVFEDETEQKETAETDF